MIGLLLIAYFAGVIAGVSPCILPILPVILVGWTAPVADEARASTLRRRRSPVSYTHLTLPTIYSV